jgi:hypothetical protein
MDPGSKKSWSAVLRAVEARERAKQLEEIESRGREDR